jgi:putative ABC transport system permease protein
VVDNGEPLAAASRAVVAGHACVERVRGIVFTYASLRKPSGIVDSVQVIGFEPSPGQNLLPWSMTVGLPADLHRPMRVAVDELDFGKLELGGRRLGAPLEVGGRTVYVAGVTQGIRSFSLAPYVFAEAGSAQAITGLADGQFNFWVVDLKKRSCLEEVRQYVSRHVDLSAQTREEFEALTQEYWVAGSGAGTALGFSALLGLIVGVVIVGQTLYSLTKEHLRELGTLKAMGASRREILGFIGWQALFLAGFGAVLGTAASFGVKQLMFDYGLLIELSPSVLALGIGSVLLICALASIGSVRTVLKLDAAEVFK